MPNHTNKQGLVYCMLCDKWKSPDPNDREVIGFDYIYCADCRADRHTLYEKYWSAYNRLRMHKLNLKPERRQYTAQWQKDNPQWVKQHGLVAANNRRARKVRLLDDWTTKDWERCLEYWGYKCAVCGRVAGLWHTIAADHWIPLTNPNCPGTTATNMIPLCHGLDGCNNSKHDRSPREWLVEKLGSKKAEKILNEIEAYFRSLDNHI